ncbi:hypothetical protein [Leucobacter sp. GX24907]
MSVGRRPTETEALQAAGRVLAVGIMRTMSMDPHEAALGAYIPRVTPPVEELEARIRAKHAEAAARMKRSA